jgi:hypothetical protein
MADDTSREVPEGVALFPPIPAQLGVNPLLLAVLHAIVFLSGSNDDIVHPDAADEVVEGMADYFRRLQGEALRRAREDMGCLVAYARREKWPRQEVHALKAFLADLGVEGEDA